MFLEMMFIMVATPVWEKMQAPKLLVKQFKRTAIIRFVTSVVAMEEMIRGVSEPTSVPCVNMNSDFVSSFLFWGFR